MTTFEHLSSRLGLDASDYSAGANEAASASEDVAMSTDEMSESLFEVDVAGAAAGAGLAGMATAGQRVMDSTRDTREELARTATQIDATQDELDGMVRGLSDATLSHEEITGAMREFQGLGADTREEMEDYITTADTIADATGSSADAIARDLAPQVRALDGDLDGLEENMDAFVMAAENSSLSIDDIGRNLGQLDFEPLREMGVESDQAALAMAEFADKTGLPPRQLRTEFKSAVEESNGDLEQFEENLGLGEGALEELSEEVDENAGIAEEQADAVGDQASTMDELRSSFADARLAASGYLGPLESLMPAAQSAGIAMVGLSTINFSQVVPSLIAATTAAAPLLLPLLAITAAVGALALAWDNNWLGIQDRTKDGIEFIRDLLGSLVDFVKNPLSLADTFGDVFTNAKDRAIGAVSDAVADVKGLVRGLGDGIAGIVTGAWNSIIPSEVGLDPVTLPTVTVDAGPLGSTTVGGQEIFGGVSVPMPQLGSGGHIDRGGVAELHEGEQVVPAAQVGQRGEIKPSMDQSDMENALESTVGTRLDRLERVISALGDEFDIDVTVEPDRGRYDPF